MKHNKHQYRGLLGTTGFILFFACGSTVFAEGPTLEVSGVLEGEFGYSSEEAPDGTKTSGSDVTLATVELGFDSQINDNVSAHILLLHEEDDTALEVDEGTITIGKEEGLSFTIGQMYLPFGVYESNMVSDPLTLELGEIRESAMMLSYNMESISSSFYLFNGDTLESSGTATPAEDSVEHMGFSVGYTKDALSLGVDYISSIGDSDTIQDALLEGDDSNGGPAGSRVIKSFVAGAAIHGMYATDRFNVIVEYVTALDEFETTDFDTAPPKKLQPSATNIEFGFTTGDNHFGVAIQSTDDAVGVLNENAISFSYARDLFENTGIAVELAQLEDYATTDGGSGNDTTVITVQVATEF